MEQLIGIAPEEIWVIKAIYFIAKMRVKAKDFYEAYHTLCRLPKNGKINQKISDFKQLIEGVIMVFLFLNRSSA